jgi:RNA polymerase sigma-70 factor (ECF subfamily)
VIDRTQFDRDLVALLPMLRSTALKKLRNGDAADELVQQTALKALRCAHQYTPGTNFKAWVFRILFTTMMSGFRQSKRAPVQLDAEDVEAMAMQQPRQDQLVEQDHVRKVMKVLPIQMRHVLVRVCVEGRSYEETAAEIDVTVGTIKSRLWRARAAVEQMLGAA